MEMEEERSWSREEVDATVKEAFERQDEDSPNSIIAHVNQYFKKKHGKSLTDILPYIEPEESSVTAIVTRLGLRPPTIDEVSPISSGRASPDIFQKRPAQCTVTSKIPAAQWVKRRVFEQWRRDSPDNDVDLDLTRPNYLYLTGKKAAAVDQARVYVLCTVQEIENNYDYKVVKVPNKFVGRLIGTQGKNIKEMKERTGARINVPKGKGPNPDSPDQTDVTIEGTKEAVEKASDEIDTELESMQKAITREVEIPARFIGLFIGTKGKAREKMEKDYPGLKLHIRNPKTDGSPGAANLRGPRKVVRQAEGAIKDRIELLLSEELIEEAEHIPSHLHYLIHGPKFVNIARIRNKYSMDIVFKRETDEVIYIGRRKDIPNAMKALAKIRDAIILHEEEIPKRFHGRLIGKKGKNLEWMKEGQVKVKFPPKEEDSDKVEIRGTKGRIEKALQYFRDALSDLEEKYHEERFYVDHAYYPHIIGKDGNRIKELLEEYPDVEVQFKDEIEIRGPRSKVQMVKNLIHMRVVDHTEIHGEPSTPQPPPSSVPPTRAPASHTVQAPRANGMPSEPDHARATSSRPGSENAGRNSGNRPSSHPPPPSPPQMPLRQPPQQEKSCVIQ